jgi:hypothetical protein
MVLPQTMGGNAFAQDGIVVTRIDDQLYHQTANDLHSILGRFYEKVLLPPSAPGKVDHGDIDFLVSQPKPHNHDQEIEKAIAEELGAAAVYRNSAMTSYAIPHSQQLDQYIQLDTQLCEPEDLAWLYFITSYGDLVPILGSIHHKLGLIINDKGLWVQLDLPKTALTCGVPRNEMVVFLTLDSDRMMEFLGLDAVRYRKGFSSEEEIFSWIKEGRYFRPISQRTSAAPQDGSIKGDSARAVDDAPSTAKRRMLARFGTYSQTHPAGPLAISSPAAVASAAVTFFDKRQEYEGQMAFCQSEVQDFEFWQQVRARLSGSSSRKARIIKSLKKWVEVEDGEMRIAESALKRNVLSHGSEEEREDRVKWIAEHWEEAYEKEKGIEKEKAAEKEKSTKKEKDTEEEKGAEE